MRKRIVMAAFTAVVFVVVGYVLTQPKTGSIDYHKARIAQLSNVGTPTPWAKVLRTVTGVSDIVRPDYAELEKRIDWHLEKLRELGFWEERTYAFTNRTLSSKLLEQAATDLVQNPSIKGTPVYFYTWQVQTNGSQSNTFSVRVPATDIARWDELVRTFDVPENAK